MKNTPKNWKLISRGFLRYVWQHGQRKYIQEGSGLKQVGWKWTSGIKLAMFFDEDVGVFMVHKVRPGHPTVTVFSSSFADIVMEWMREEMKKIDRQYKPEED